MFKKSREHPNEIRYHKKFRKFTTPIIIIVLLIIGFTVVFKGDMYVTGFYLSIFLIPLFIGGYIRGIEAKAEIEEVMPYLDKTYWDYVDAREKMRDEWDVYYQQNKRNESDEYYKNRDNSV